MEVLGGVGGGFRSLDQVQQQVELWQDGFVIWIVAVLADQAFCCGVFLVSDMVFQRKACCLVKFIEYDGVGLLLFEK